MAQDSPPEIVTSPDAGMIQLVGSTKSLTCSAAGSPNPVYSWIQNDVYYKNYSRNDVNMKTLRIVNLQENDSGMFRCLASNSLGAELSQAAEIKVAVLQNFTATGSKEIMVDQGKAVILPMPPIKTLALDVTWQENNNTLSEDYFYSFTQNLSLVLLSVDKNIMGKEYRVKAEYVFTSFSTVSSPYILRVRDSNNPTNIAPEVIVPPENTSTVKGSDKVELICIINARPMNMLTISWYHVYGNGTRKSIDTDDKYIVTNYRRKLIIKNLDESDTGQYQCEGLLGSLGYPPARSSANLFVQVLPMIPPGALPRVIERDFSETVILPCTAQGVPQPTLHWYFNGWSISPVVRPERYTLYPNGTLEIRNLDLPDAGKYQCFARNPAGETYKAVWLKVNSAPPQITKAPENLTKVESSDARFYCQVTGAPAPNITWTKVTGTNEEPVVFGGRYQRFPDSLSIATVIKSDSGAYRCNATNIKGTQSAQAYLLVITKTNIVRPPQNQTVIISTQVTFECGIIRDENTLPVWEWFFYKSPDFVERQINNSNRYFISEIGSLIISGVSAQDIGKYRCHVISAGGNDSRTASLNVIELPRPPSIMTVALNPLLNNSVVITWTPAFNGNSALRKYIITYRQENPNGNNVDVAWDVYPDNINPAYTSYAVNNLLPSRYYRFRISAVNEVGEGNASQPMPNPAIKMPAQPPSEPPRNFFCKQGGDQEIEATWETPVESSWNGNLQGYVLYYKVQNLPSIPMSEKKVEGANVHTAVIGSLVPFKEYAVRIAAYNEEGVGVMSNPFLVWTREGRPTAAPSNVVPQTVNSTTIKLQWDPPYPGEIYGNNLGYMVQLWQNEVLVRSDFVPSHSENLEGRQEYYVGNLAKFKWYNFTIACRTSPGLGPFSSPVAQQTDEDVPGSVNDLKFDQIQDRSCRVNWSPPREVNGILQVGKKNQNESRQTVDLPSMLTYYTVSNLSPVTNYTIYVAAKTRKGIGAWVSADIQSGVPPELPGPPYNLAFSNIGARTVLLQFFPGYDGKTSITKWIVLAKEGEATTYTEIYSVSNPTANEIWVQNLKPYTGYQLKVIAENIVGRSDPSQPSQRFETLQAAPAVPPGNVTVRAINSTGFRISWTPISSQDWNGVPRGYKIDYRIWSTEKEDAGVALVQESKWTTVELANGINIDSYNLVQLQEWMDYQIRMNSYNDVGVSPFSPTTTARTRESTPSASPSDLKALTVSTTQILVSWNSVPRLEQNGQILGYKVFYKARDSNTDPLFQDVDGKDTYNVTLGGLRKFVWYNMQILAYTRMGDGVLSSPVSGRTDEDVPGPPIIIYFPNVTYTSAVVVWNPPKEPNGIITQYKVSYRKQRATTDENEVLVEPNYREYGVDNLEREVVYVFSVTAKTQKGWGTPASVEVLTMLNRDRPDQPSKPTVGNLQVQARSITIAWHSGPDNYGPIRNYTIQYKMRGGAWTVFPDGIPPSASSYTVTGLRPNTWYQFCVAATNDIGTSDYSEPSSEIQTSPDKPDGAPQNLNVIPLDQTTIQASWEPPPSSTWNSDVIVGYRLRFRVEETNNWEYLFIDSGHEKLITNGLSPSNFYEIMVQAYNFLGGGPWSLPAFVSMEIGTLQLLAMCKAINRSSSTLEVTWAAPPPPSWNGALSGYKVLYFKNTSGNPVEQQQISAGTRTVLDSLETFTVYMISVQAYNLAGDGPQSPLTKNLKFLNFVPVPGPPGPIKFTNITMHQLTVNFIPPAVTNGIVLLYEMEYFPVPKDPFEPLPPKRTLRANETVIVVTDLKENVRYVFSIAANTSVGRGSARTANVSTGPQPGSPSPPSKPTVSEHNSGTLLIQWVDGDSGRSPIYGYCIQTKKADESEYVTLQQEITGEPKVYISLTLLNPETSYQFSVIAINDQGISLPSVPSDVFVTPGLALPQVAKPFHTEWWFLVIIALTGVIIILVIVSLLCLVTRRRRDNKEMKRSQTATTVMSEPSEPEEGGFPTYELRRSTRNTAQRNGTVKNIYARTPPRPSPASVAYSDDDDAMSTAKPPIPDDSDSSVTDKPSDLEDSTEPSDEESDAESEKVPASPPPPAFSMVYANNDQVRQSWRFPNSNNAYVYTDSEADSSHYAIGLHNGQLMMNNTARARTPMTGFSSFV
ncbi:hypothetical protein C0Q70_01554 [Pomacea canaliculata]|uniref:Protein sidekick n=1 Tax=Pomacea canaliculata TaxID=400727 RepID=A0A2T7PZT9_POMCA|nr:hypothetical protein C0Q70_01554 [Pomacea canaliculata]